MALWFEEDGYTISLSSKALNPPGTAVLHSLHREQLPGTLVDGLFAITFFFTMVVISALCTAIFNVLFFQQAILIPLQASLLGTFDMDEGMTYEQMQTVIEEVLEECGYYNFTSSRYQYYPWGARNHPARR